MNTTKFNISFFSFSTFALVLFYSTSAVFAQGALDTLLESIESLGGAITGLTSVVFTLSIIFFFWKVGLFIFASDATARSEARKGMLNGLIAVFVIASIWGIVALLQGTIGIGDDSRIPVPTLGG